MPKVFLTNEEREEFRFNNFLRGMLRMQKKTYEDLGRELNLDKSGISQRINGKTRWTLPEIITALQFLETEFTIGGRNGKANRKPAPDPGGDVLGAINNPSEYRATYLL